MRLEIGKILQPDEIVERRKSDDSLIFHHASQTNGSCNLYLIMHGHGRFGMCT